MLSNSRALRWGAVCVCVCLCLCFSACVSDREGRFCEQAQTSIYTYSFHSVNPCSRSTRSARTLPDAVGKARKDDDDAAGKMRQDYAAATEEEVGVAEKGEEVEEDEEEGLDGTNASHPPPDEGGRGHEGVDDDGDAGEEGGRLTQRQRWRRTGREGGKGREGGVDDGHAGEGGAGEKDEDLAEEHLDDEDLKRALALSLTEAGAVERAG